MYSWVSLITFITVFAQMCRNWNYSLMFISQRPALTIKIAFLSWLKLIFINFFALSFREKQRKTRRNKYYFNFFYESFLSKQTSFTIIYLKGRNIWRGENVAIEIFVEFNFAILPFSAKISSKKYEENLFIRNNKFHKNLHQERRKLCNSIF